MQKIFIQPFSLQYISLSSTLIDTPSKSPR
nr:MAG TPA: hypothetical protein [Caudoviricetes sp.]